MAGVCILGVRAKGIAPHIHGCTGGLRKIVGFWGLAFFYPLNGIHHFLYSPIPMYAQYGAIISTIAVEFVVATVIFNFMMTIRGSGDALRTSRT